MTNLRARDAGEQMKMAEYPPSPRAWYAVFIMMLAATFGLLDQGIMGLLIQSIKRDFNLNDTQAGLLLGPAFVVFYAVLGLPLSTFVDRSKRTVLMAIGIFIWSAATAACGLATSFISLFTARVMVGAGEAVNGPATYSIVADYFPKERLPRALAVIQLGALLGTGLSMLIGGWLIWLVASRGAPNLPFIGELRPWQFVFFLLGVAGFPVAGLMLTVREPARRGIEIRPSKHVPFGDCLAYLFGKISLFGPMFLGLALSSFSAGSSAWAAPFFERTYGWPASRFGMIFGALTLACTLVGLFLGVALVEALHRKGHEDAPLRLFLFCRLGALPFVIAMPLMANAWLAMGCLAISMFSAGMSTPSQHATLQTVTPSAIRGRVTAMFLFLLILFGSGIGPVMIGFITDFVFASPADLRWSLFATNLVFMPSALIVTWLGWKPYRAEVQRINALEHSRRADCR